MDNFGDMAAWFFLFLGVAITCCGFYFNGRRDGAVGVTEGTLLCDKLPNGEWWIREAGE